VLGLLHEVCRRAQRHEAAGRLARLATAMSEDFQQQLFSDGVLAGFLVFGNAAPRPLLHPRDRTTGIRYRLLPMTRAVLAGLLTREQAQRHFDLIGEHLLFPDGVRLMSDPVPYRGGVERWFKRAETAANFGREIGLMYTHAHLRYVEALARLGRGDAMWEMLGRVTPVLLSERVPNAATRQANTFFSSSDGAFADRYEAAARFAELKDGKVAVNAGWRIYSSGPGLYIHRIVQGMLGLRDSFGDLVFDPVLPHALDGLVAVLDRDGRRLEIRYSRGALGHGVRRLALNGSELPLDRRESNAYREGAARLAASVFDNNLKDGVNVLQIETG
jgi:CRISPR-associated protein Csx3